MAEYKETYEDYRIKYNGCIVSYDGFVARIENIPPTESGKVRFEISLHNKEDGTKRVSKTVDLDDEKLNLRPLARGCVNLGKTVIVYNVAPNLSGGGKYKEGFSSENTIVIDPFVQERKLLRSSPVAFADPLLYKAWLNNAYEAPTDALNAVLNKEKIGSAFSPDYFFGIKYCTNAVMLFRREFMIGRVTKEGTVVLKPLAHCYAEELEEFGLKVKRASR